MSRAPFDYYVEIDRPDPSTPAECSDCDWRGVVEDLAEIGECSLTPGDSSPAGRCPECDALAYVAAPPVIALLAADHADDAARIEHERNVALIQLAEQRRVVAELLRALREIGGDIATRAIAFATQGEDR